jgi:hypothetical protein
VVRDGPKDKKSRLLALTEKSGKAALEGKDTPGTTRVEKKLRNGTIVNLSLLHELREHDGISTDESAVPNILVAYKDGGVDCIAGDLSAAVWEHSAAASGETEVEYSSVIDSYAASKGLLKNREDVLALLGQSIGDKATAGSASLLLQILRTGEQKHLCVSVIKKSSGASLHLRSSNLTEVMRMKLSRDSSMAADYDLHPASGLLYEHQGTQLKIYDLSGATPKSIFELGKMRSSIVNSFARISPSCLLTFSDDTASIYETKFGSILGSLPLAAPVRSGSKTDSSDTSLVQHFNVVSSFSDLGLVVAVLENNLIALRTSEATSGLKRRRLRGPALLDVLGKGNAGTGLDVVDPTKKQEEKQIRWEEWQRRVDGLVETGNLMELEALIAKDLNLSPASAAPSSVGQASSNGHTDQPDDAEEELWELPMTAYDPLYADNRKARYVLGKAFIWRQPPNQGTLEPHRLELAFKSRNIMRWLGRMGLLSAPHVQQILPQPNEHEGARLKVAPGDIMAAVERVDQGFLLTCDLLSLPIHWDIAEVMQGLRLLIQSLEDAPAPQDEDAVMGEGDVETKIEHQEAAAQRDLERLVSFVEDGPFWRSEALRRLIARLQAFPLEHVTKSMRSFLSQHQIVFLIRVLLIELHEGGWTSLYFNKSAQQYEQDMDLDADEPGDLNDLTDGAADPTLENSHNICLIANLLICAINAVGNSGWIVGLSGEPDISEDLIARLRVQISAALTGCFEAQHIGLFLNEVCRTSDSARQRKRKRRQEANASIDPVSNEEGMLPVGGSYGPMVLKTRERKKPSGSKRVGKYSFEKLRW